ncbi:hydrocephalus-inducing protein-like isoform 2-T5 [Salvelinus alpinus]
MSCHSEAFLDSLQLEPMEGVVPPKDRRVTQLSAYQWFPVVVSFTPTQDGVVIFNLLVQLKGKVQPLTMNVKTEGYSMNACMQCESTEGGVAELSPGNSPHQVDFKRKCVLKDMGLNIKIKNGPAFSYSILDSAGLDVSFLKHTFVMGFIYNAGMVLATQTLIISNNGERGIRLTLRTPDTRW